MYPPASYLGPRIQPTFEFVLVEKGTIDVSVNKDAFHFPENSISLMFPDHEEYYSFSKERETKLIYFHFEFPDLTESFLNFLRNSPKTIPLSSRIDKLARRILDLSDSNILYADQLIKSTLVQLFSQFLVESVQPHDNRVDITLNSITEKACDFIQRNLENLLSLSRIASSVAVSPEHLIRLFRTDLGITPIVYVWESRIKKGIDLLENSGLSINLIAEQCGFKTRNHFSKKVKEYAGYSPRELRKKIWGTS